MAQRQADLSETADRNARRDRQLLEAPLLHVIRFGYHVRDEDGDLTLVAYLENPSGRDAYRIHVEVRGKGDRRATLSPHVAEAGLDNLGQGKSEIHVSLADFRNASVSLTKGWNPPNATTYPWLHIVISYEGVLGQQVTDTYSLWADHRPEPLVLHDLFAIQPSVEDADPYERSFAG